MEELKNNKIFIFMFWLFLSVSIIHVGYAVYTFRGMYCDGAFDMIILLNNFSNGIYTVFYDPGHTRFGGVLLQQLPVVLANKFLFIKDKFVLMGLFTFFQFAIPILAIVWNYFLTKRTGRTDILFWSIFVYGTIIIPYSIFSVVESIQGVVLHFILWNYLVSDIEYKKRDFVFVIFLLFIMAGTYEYVAYLGVVFFLAHFYYIFSKKNLSLKSQIMKFIIGWGSLAAAIYDIIYILNVPGEDGEIKRFLNESVDYIPHILHINFLFSIAAVAIILILLLKKKRIGLTLVSVVGIIFTGIFIYLFKNLQLSIYPMWEQHIRSIPCWALPIIFIGLYIKDLFFTENKVRMANFICVALICCIFQSCWQLVESYYWDKNIQYIKNELANTRELLYIPAEHEDVISDFHTETLRRFIWHGVYAATSILFSDTYKQKTLLVNYDEPKDPWNGTYRDKLYVLPEVQKISIPFGVTVDIKNDYWDLTECAEALDKYNKEHNIKTER